MPTQRCTQCGSKLNVSKLERGSKFACFNCGAILVVGAKPRAVKKSLADGPVFQPKSRPQAEDTVPTPSRRPVAAAPAAGKSKVPLGVIGVVIAVGVVLALVIGGGGNENEGSVGGGGGSRASRVTVAEWWAGIDPDLSTASAEQLRGFLSRARSRGYDKSPSWASMADALFEALLAKAPDDTAANRHMGRVALQGYAGFAPLWSAVNDNFKLLDKPTRAFLKKYEDRVEGGAKVWMDPAEYQTARETLSAFRVWLKRLESDPTIRQIERGRSRAQGELDKFDAGVATARPFILFVGYRKPPAFDPDTHRPARDKIAADYKPALQVMVAEFEKRFRAPLDLPAMDGSTPLYLWLFENAAEYGTHTQTRPLFGAGPEIAGGFSVKSRWAYAGIADPRVAGRDLAHTAVYQLQWRFSRDPKKTYLNYFEEWNGLWFTLGFASWLGGGVDHDAATGRASWTGVDPRRKAHLKTMVAAGVPWVSLREFTQLESWEGFRRWINDSWWPSLDADDVSDGARDQVGPQREPFARQLLFAQAWGLAHFLNENYAAQYKDLLMTALRGKRKPQKYKTDRMARWRSTYSAFADIMGLKSDADWDKLSKRYEKHLDQLAR